MKKLVRRVVIYFLLFMVAMVGVIIWANRHVEKVSEGYLYTDLAKIPAENVGLVLGTSRKLVNGHNNLYFDYRIKAAVLLFKAGKVKHLLVSGDNHIKEYDEPEDMRKALIAEGVPDSCITLDYAGFRTLDSIIRCWKVFGQVKFIVISQPFHNRRAIFLGRHYGLIVTAYNADEVGLANGFRTRLREYFARVKAVLDVYLLNKQPHFLGEPVKINL
jgi:SanA protein